jgi:pimeloyl-ACP methyl ester carboxylesterase
LHSLTGGGGPAHGAAGAYGEGGIVPYVETPDEVPLHYLDEGPRSDSGIFLIHAEPFSCRFWQRNIPELSHRFRVVAMDVRGRGESGKTDAGHCIDQYARDLRHMLETLGFTSAVVVGWSLGGSIVWNYIHQFGGDRLAGYVNLDQPPYRFVSEEHLQQRLASIRTRRLQHHTNTVRGYFGPDVEVPEETLRWMVYECMKTPTSAHATVVEESFRADYSPFMNEVRVPTRTFWSRHGSIQPDVAEAMRKAMRDSELVFFERSGHLIPWIESEKFNRELAGFASAVLGGTLRGAPR